MIARFYMEFLFVVENTEGYLLSYFLYPDLPK
jgi:hypothetical protein